MGQQWDQERNQKIPETNENENTTIQILCDTGKTILRGNSYITGLFRKKKKKQQQENLK